MNYWTDVGWIIIPMNTIEIGFTLAMCWLTHRLDQRKK